MALEHLLLALVDDADASAVMTACRVDLEVISKKFGEYLDNEPKTQTSDEVKPTAGVQRVIQRAVLPVQASGRSSVTGAQVLVAMFSEQESRAAHILGEQAMTRVDAVSFMRGPAKGLQRSPRGPRALLHKPDIRLRGRPAQ